MYDVLHVTDGCLTVDQDCDLVDEVGGMRTVEVAAEDAAGRRFLDFVRKDRR